MFKQLNVFFLHGSTIQWVSSNHKGVLLLASEKWPEIGNFTLYDVTRGSPDDEFQELLVLRAHGRL